MRTALDHLISDLFYPTPATATTRPAYRVKTESGADIITLDLPGVVEEDVNIEVDGDLLRVSGDRKDRINGKFAITFSMDERHDPNGIEASLKNGVLTVKVGYREVAKPRRIPLLTN